MTLAHVRITSAFHLRFSLLEAARRSAGRYAFHLTPDPGNVGAQGANKKYHAALHFCAEWDDGLAFPA
jgi:hypothetical protein